jgi:hypothetical protein
MRVISVRSERVQSSTCSAMQELMFLKMLHNIPEEQRSCAHCGGSLKSLKLKLVLSVLFHKHTLCNIHISEVMCKKKHLCGCEVCFRKKLCIRNMYVFITLECSFTLLLMDKMIEVSYIFWNIHTELFLKLYGTIACMYTGTHTEYLCVCVRACMFMHSSNLSDCS